MKSILRTVLVALAIVLVNAAPPFASAGPYEDGIEAYQRGDYTTALQIFRSLAETGDARGQNGFGVMSEWGQGVPQDDAAAVKWYRMAADQGFSKAQVNLGGMYVTGRGVQQDYVEAAKWYRKAAKQGHAKG